jgi:uncharacterized membrane protein
MLQGHVFHSLTAKNLRESGPYVLSQFVGGITPAIFLFLTGVTLAFLMESRERQGATAGSRWLSALGRARYLVVLAVLFRFQLWLFAYPQSPWQDMFKVDILNCMALSLGVMSLFALLPSAARIRAAGALGIAIAAASPLISAIDWQGIHPFISSYFVPDYNQFAFFPWAAFVAFGISAGTILRVVERDALAKVMQWSAITGFALVLAGQYFSSLPYSLYDKSEFWLNSPALIVIKLGVILMIAAFAYLWNQQAAVREWSWIRQLGTTSLIVYWVHIELVYGRWLGSWKESLPVSKTAAIAIVVISLMLVLSLAQTRWRRSRTAVLESAREFFAEMGLANRRRVSGD